MVLLQGVIVHRQDHHQGLTVHPQEVVLLREHILHQGAVHPQEVILLRQEHRQKVILLRQEVLLRVIVVMLVEVQHRTGDKIKNNSIYVCKNNFIRIKI